MRKFTLFLLLLMYVATSIAQIQDGVYQLYWRDDNRGYLTYHETDYPTEAKLSGVTLSGCANLHYATNATGIKTQWYLITSDLGLKYIFEITTGKFISIGNTDGGYVTNKLSTDTPCPITLETPVYRLSTANEATPLSYQLRAVGSNGTVYRLCSGCGTNQSGHPVRWETSNLNDGGFPLAFVSQATASVSDDVLNAAKATISQYEQELSDALALAQSKLDDALFSYSEGDYLDLKGKASSNSDQNTGGGSNDGDGIAALVDGNDEKYFHTRWSGTVVNEPHYWQIDLGEGVSLSEFSFYYKTRNQTGSPAPTEITVYGSNDASGTFTELAVLNENMPNYNTASGEYNSPVITSQQSYRYLRFTVTRSAGPGDERREKQYFFGLAEFKIKPLTVNVGNSEYASKSAELKALQKAVTESTKNVKTVEAVVLDLNAKLKPFQRYINDLSQLSNTSVYTITPANTASTGAICAKEGDLTKLYTTHRAGVAVNSKDEYQQFAILNCNGKYFLYNVGAQKFVKKSGEGTALTESVTIDNEFVFEASNEIPYPGHNYVQADYPWCIVFEGFPLCATAADNFSSYGGVVTNWNYNSDSGTVLEIVEVDTDVSSLAEAYAKVEAYMYAATTVTYKYMYNGEEIGSEELPAVVGKQLPAPVNVPLGYTSEDLSGRNVSAANEVVEVLLTFTGYPFEYSESVENIEHWYYIQMHSNQKKYIQYIDGANYIEWADAELTAEEEDLYTWAFVGTPEQGFKLVNLALGTEYALNSNGSGNPAMGTFDTAVCWKPVNSIEKGNEGYFCLQYPGGNYMNAQSGKVAFWSSADAGSTLLLTERVIEERNISLTVTAEGDGSVAIKGRVGTEAQFANGNNVTVMATVNRGYLFREWQNNGEVVSTDADYSFVISESMSLKAVFVPKLAVTAVLDFTEDLWNIPRENEIYDAEGYPVVMDAESFTNGEYTVKLDPTAAVDPIGLYCYNTSGSLCLYNTNTKIVLPEFDFDVAKIEIIGGSQGANYPNADMNVYVGNNAVSTACTGLGGTNVFEIAETAQAAGNIYELKIGSNGGKYSSVVYINKIKVYPKDGLVAPEFDVEAGVYTQEFTVNISSPTATKENVTNVSYYYIKSGTDSGVEFQPTDCKVTIDKTCTLIAVVMLDYYGVEYYSETSEVEYIISDYLVAQKLTVPETGKVFIVADGNTAVKYDSDKKDVLNVAPIDAEEGTSIKTAEYYSYTLEETNGGYFLKDISDSYLAVSVGTSPSFVTAKSVPGTSTAMYTWTVTIDGDGNATISNNGYTLVYENNKFVLRSGGAGTAMLPMLYGKVSGNIDVILNSVEGSKLINGFEKSGMATFSAPYSTVLPEGVTAYYALSDGVKAEYISLVQYSGAELPAGEGFILVGDPGVTTMTVSRNAVEGLGDGLNKLGNTADGPKMLTANSCYLLGMGAQGAGFYACGAGTLAQYKAYLNIDATASRSIVIRFPGTTDIDKVQGENVELKAVYDLTGRKIEYITAPGIYIINGKKVLLK